MRPPVARRAADTDGLVFCDDVPEAARRGAEQGPQRFHCWGCDPRRRAGRPTPMGSYFVMTCRRPRVEGRNRGPNGFTVGDVTPGGAPGGRHRWARIL